MNTRLLSVLAASALAFSTSAHALFVDFTDESGNFTGTGLSSATVVVGGVTVTLSATPAMNFSDNLADESSSDFCDGFSGTPSSPTFACDSDGAGIGDDEINGDEVLKVSFSKTVEVTAYYFLDFFFEVEDEESANVDFNNGFDEDVMADEPFEIDADGFFERTGLSQNTSTVTFVALDSNDLQGVGDFALAGLEFNLIEGEPEIPVPAALPLILTGIAGLALFRRRRAA